MKWKKYVLGLALAAACYMPSFANSFDEAMAVTEDPRVAYTFYIGMNSGEVEDAMDALTDWKKVVHDYKSFRELHYTRTLEDGTIEEITLPNFKRTQFLKEYHILFTTKTVGEAAKMYYQAMARLRKTYGSPTSHQATPTYEDAGYNLDDGHLQFLIGYDKKMKSFGIARNYFDVEGWAAYEKMVKENYGNRYGRDLN